MTMAVLPAARTGMTSEMNPSSGERWRTDDSYCADRLVHGDGDVSERWVVDCTVVFVGPRGVGEDALDAGGNFGGGLRFAYRGCQAVGDFVAAWERWFSAT